ncbi:MAG: DUF86 domain-containing protein [Defluviitaleaceae bacterium]|nr:DUF86 domain-containing protein [Defluviitaleaceae bacterium]
MKKVIKDDFYRIQKIHFYCESIADFTKNKTVNDLKSNDQLNFAVVFSLGQIGEHMNKLTSEFKNKYCEIPWKDIISMRHRIVHDYEGVNVDILWESVQEGIPQLLDEINKLLKVHKGDDST